MNRFFIGTSGWSYDWNPDGLEWYASNSGMNAIELNASYYKFPLSDWVKRWSKIDGLRWSVKVNKNITHMHRMNKNSYILFERFMNLFKPLKEKIDFFLFQFPKQAKPSILDDIERFLKKFDVAEKFALEARSKEWFSDLVYKRCEELGISMVSIDAPFAREIVRTSNSIYLRMHGRKEWYDYNYNIREMAEIYKKIALKKPKNTYIFFNNNNMLENAQLMEKIKSKDLSR